MNVLSLFAVLDTLAANDDVLRAGDLSPADFEMLAARVRGEQQ